MAQVVYGRKSIWRSLPRILASCKSGCDSKVDSIASGGSMALSLRSLFGAGMSKAPLRGEAELDVPTTQVKMGALQPGYDPLATVSIMDQLRTAASATRQPQRLWLVGHLPIVKQFQLLGALLLAFVVLVVAMVYLNNRLAGQAAA